MIAVPNNRLKMCVRWQFRNIINFDDDSPIKTILEVTILVLLQIANMTEQDFTNPIPDFISDLYTLLLIHLNILLESLSRFSFRTFFNSTFLTHILILFIFCREDKEQVKFHAVEHLQNPDFHVESVRAFKLYNQINEVLTTLECQRKFSQPDLLMPNPH
ncbi:hypothetical protein JHK85_044063 [Glycine max]|nr:hypothetical protein JHK85_044063 [Glycine max]